MTREPFRARHLRLRCVLIESEPIANRVHAQTLTGCGYAVGDEELQDRFCGISDAEMLATIEREWGRALPDDFALRIATALARQYRCSLEPIAGIAEALAGLSLPVCVASSGTPERIRLGLEVVGLSTASTRTCSARRWSGTASPRPIFFSMPPPGWGRRPNAAS